MCPAFGKPISTLPFVGYLSNRKRGGCVVSLSWWMGRYALPCLAAAVFLIVYCVLSCAQVWWAQHLAAPFGAVGSVHGWERVGAGVAHIGRSLLNLPLLRYVDDYWSPER